MKKAHHKSIDNNSDKDNSHNNDNDVTRDRKEESDNNCNSDNDDDFTVLVDESHFFLSRKVVDIIVDSVSSTVTL